MIYNSKEININPQVIAPEPPVFIPDPVYSTGDILLSGAEVARDSFNNFAMEICVTKETDYNGITVVEVPQPDGYELRTLPDKAENEFITSVDFKKDVLIFTLDIVKDVKKCFVINWKWTRDQPNNNEITIVAYSQLNPQLYSTSKVVIRDIVITPAPPSIDPPVLLIDSGHIELASHEVIRDSFNTFVLETCVMKVKPFEGNIVVVVSKPVGYDLESLPDRTIDVFIQSIDVKGGNVYIKFGDIKGESENHCFPTSWTFVPENYQENKPTVIEAYSDSDDKVIVMVEAFINDPVQMPEPPKAEPKAPLIIGDSGHFKVKAKEVARDFKNKFRLQICIK